MARKRLDDILVERKVVLDRREAFVKVTEGFIFVDGQKAISPAQLVLLNAKIEVRAGQEYVGRGAYKLEAALEKFGIDVSGKICADIGSATGGFTEVLLKHGAKRVYAIDTARGKLAPKLREDPRVVVMEKTDIRDLKKLPHTVDLVTIDVSLISLRNILSRLKSGRLLGKEAEVIALFKPQYETRDPKILKHGVVKDSAAREELLNDFLLWAKNNSWAVRDWTTSPIKGSKGNIEYLLWLRSS